MFFDFYSEPKVRRRKRIKKIMKRGKRRLKSYRQKNPESPFGYSSKTAFRAHKIGRFLGL
jgi:hypothetical protein